MARTKKIIKEIGDDKPRLTKKELSCNLKEDCKKDVKKTKKDLDKKLNKIKKDRKETLDEIKKTKRKYDKILKNLEEKSSVLNDEQSSIYDEISKLDYEEGRSIEETAKSMVVPYDVLNIIFGYCAKRNPWFYFITTTTYRYFGQDYRAFYRCLLITDEPDKYGIDCDDDFRSLDKNDNDHNRLIPVANIGEAIKILLTTRKAPISETFMERDTLKKCIFYRANEILLLLKSKDMLPWSTDVITLLTRFEHKFNQPYIDGKKFNLVDSQIILAKWIYIIHILLNEVFNTLDYTLAFHKAAYKTTDPRVIVTDEKTMKWYLLQKVTFDKKTGKKERHAFKSMHVILEYYGGPFYVTQPGFKCLKMLLDNCFYMDPFEKFSYGPKNRRIPIHIEFLKKPE